MGVYNMINNIKRNIFGDHSDKDINQWLESVEHKYYIEGGKQGLISGACLCFPVAFGIGVLIGMMIN
jgi:hypothetical protein